jgi:putative phosphoesterase
MAGLQTDYLLSTVVVDMRVLLLADIHANWAALQAIRERFDYCFFLGDLVDYGLEPGPCIDWVRKHATHAIRGNHDHAVAQRAGTTGRNGFKYLSGTTRELTWKRMTKEQTRFLATLPVTRHVTLNGVSFLLVHATPRDPLEEYAHADAELWARRVENAHADVICVGHTHVPFCLRIGDKMVINPGSVGQPRDGDPRAAYAIWEDGRVELKRVEYPVHEVIRSVEASSLPPDAKRLSIEIFRRGTHAPPNYLPVPARSTSLVPVL